MGTNSKLHPGKDKRIMYLMNGDFFDGYSVMFTAKECSIHWENYPLGSFAVEALNMDTSILEQITKKLPLFRELFNVCLVAGSLSSSA
jgi:hypothetical protein